jgi:DNA (cytosine-5)-methyltransferase 1
MEASAHATLRLRALYRILREAGETPAAYEAFVRAHVANKQHSPEQHFADGKFSSFWKSSIEEALNLTLGNERHDAILYARIRQVRKLRDALVLIGGPPCQAYSVVGRARQTNAQGFRSRGDHRHFLYRQYLGILAKFRPEVFIMENVRGILSSTVGGERMFEQICADLENPSAALGRTPGGSEYVLLPIHVPEGIERTGDLVTDNPSRFVIRCEEHGIAQARHRVIVMGVRRQFMSAASVAPGLSTTAKPVTLASVLCDLPRLRSSLSRTRDHDGSVWGKATETERRRVMKAVGPISGELVEFLHSLEICRNLPTRSTGYTRSDAKHFSQNEFVKGSPCLNHETRSHMQSDLGRYLFCAAFAAVEKRSPASHEFPAALRPAHRNWESGQFADRFRVQVPSRPATTLTSHIAKDGHAFIHWDASQCRSMTVREAARIQTFPDDYLFLGNRTQQYVQVGNAVPPAIAKQIAGVVWSVIEKA